MMPFVWVESKETTPNDSGTKSLSTSTIFFTYEIVKKISCSINGFSEQDIKNKESPNSLIFISKFIHRVKNRENIIQLSDNQ